MTHAIDADVDDARDYVVADALEIERVEELGFVGGVGPAGPNAARRNLMGAPWQSDGRRAVLVLDERPTRPRILDWEWTGADAAALGDDEEPSGTVSITAPGFAGGTRGGSGILAFRGERRSFRFRGMTLQGRPATGRTVEGTVYRLAHVADFGGRYVAVPGAARRAGDGGVLVRNGRGVVLRFVAPTPGTQVRLGAGGIDVALEAAAR
jgi:hypothetical protein